VGIRPTAGHYKPPLIARCQQLHPGVELHVQEQGARAQRQLLLDGKLDMALGLRGTAQDGADGADDEGLAHCTIAHQRTRVAFAAHEVPDPDMPVHWSELARRPFVFYTSDFALHQAVLEHCAAAGFSPEVRLQTRYWDFIGAASCDTRQGLRCGCCGVILSILFFGLTFGASNNRTGKCDVAKHL
jgi:DNA-binding transcriptional LysR family regulator